MPDEPTRPDHDPWPVPGWPAGTATDSEDDDDWPDEDWPGDEAGPPWPPPPAGGRQGGPRRRRPLILAAVGLAALVAGAGVMLAVSSELSPAAPAASGRTQSPTVTGPGSSQLPGGALPGGGGTGGGGTAQMFIAGRVQRISATSITLGAPGRAVTAAITSATRVSGQVSSVSQIKVGDNASAQITVRDGKPTVTAIQYPAQLPSGGGVP
jgi:hypothetical protein